ncbi:ARM repeat-containing protein [Armillaria gallica]|uniref:ARM repeat-containing protein n=1 Tax=Armillaria gallica TaxID=47427 RepID=A0A2H3CV31_ARMGA|nr:ARM repeat-containing protein [Armillaria gallica]
MSGSPSKLIHMKEVTDEDRGGDTKHASSGWDRMSIPRKEVTEKRLCLEDGEKERARIAAEESVKAEPRINITSPPSGLPRPHPGPLGISTTKANIPVPPPSALATARIIDELGRFPYPEGIKGPKVELNINARDGKFIYDREFLLQFMPVCKEKPESLAAPDAIVPYPTSQPMHIGSKLGEKHNHSNRVPDPESAAALAQSLFEPVAPLRTRSKRGEKRKDSNRVPTGPGSPHGYSMGHESSAALAQSMLEPVAPLQQSANRWDRHSLGSNDPDSLDVVVRKVRGLLNKLTMEKFDSISDQIIAWANKSEKEKDSRTLVQVIRLVFESAVDQATWSEMYARLCRKMMEQISPKVQDDSIKNAEGKPIAGGQLFRKYLLNRCQEDFEQGWATKEAIAAVTAFKAIQDQAPEATAEKEGDGKEGIVLYSNEYYAMQKAKRQGLGLIKFIGELFKLQMLTERIMHECVKKLLGNVENPEEEEIESLCKLLTTVGQFLDTSKARAHMDVYFSRMKGFTKNSNVSFRMQFMLQDVLELRERKWVGRNAVAAPTTIAQIHEAAAKEKAAQEKESYQRQMSMSRGGSRRGGERGEYLQAGADGWAVPGGNSAPRPPSKAGDLSKFGQISNKGASLTFGPQSSIYAGKKDKRESVQRSNSSSQNVFSMLNNDSTAEATPREMLQRKRLVFAPRSKPVEGQENAPTTAESEASLDEEVTAEPEPVEMSEKDAKKKIQEDIKEFIAVRNLDEADVYFMQLPAKHHPLLVDKLISFAVESKETDAQLVAELFSHASTKSLCTLANFESGFAGVLEFLDDIAADAPMAFKLMAIMMKGPAFDDEQRRYLTSKTDSVKLLGLLSLAR